MPAWMEVIMDEGMSREKSLQARISADEAAFAVASIPDRTFDGEVIQIRKSAQTDAGSSVVIRTPNPDLMLKPGMSAAVRITVSQSGKVS
jgi:hypothetical protein